MTSAPRKIDGDIEERAGHLVAQRGTSSWTPAKEDELMAWLQADSRHAAAFAHAQRIYDAVALAADPDEVRRVLSAVPVRRRWQPAMLAAALLFAVLAAGSAWWMAKSPIVSPSRYTVEHISGPSEVRRLTLDDGTAVDLDAGSALSWSADGTTRRVVLTHGRAVFSVAKDPQRPFTVVVGASEARVLGTVFCVERRLSEVVVTVAEGRVRVQHAGSGPGAVVSAGEVVAGQRAILGATALIEQTGDRHFAAWRVGRLDFENLALREVVAELQRYLPQPLTVAPEVSALRLTGTFDRTGSHPVALVRAIAASLDLVLEEAADGGLRLVGR